MIIAVSLPFLLRQHARVTEVFLGKRLFGSNFLNVIAVFVVLEAISVSCALGMAVQRMQNVASWRKK